MTTSDDYTFRWQSLDSGNAASFSNLTNTKGYVTGLALDTLPLGHQKMSGLQSAYWSGYCAQNFLAHGFTGIGELVLIRHHHEKSKAYCYPIGQSGDAIRIGPEFKDFDGHHSSIYAPASFSTLFGNIPWKKTSTNEAGNL